MLTWCGHYLHLALFPDLPGVHPTSTSRDFSDQAFPSLIKKKILACYVARAGEGLGTRLTYTTAVHRERRQIPPTSTFVHVHVYVHAILMAAITDNSVATVPYSTAHVHVVLI